jgi:hypothetical protein
MKQTSKEEIDALCKILDAVPDKGYESISEASKTAVEWLAEQLLAKYRLKIDNYQEFNQAKEREVKQSQDYAAFCINCDRKNYPILDFESYLKL